jgi:hypothetical protein
VSLALVALGVYALNAIGSYFSSLCSSRVAVSEVLDMLAIRSKA